MLLTLGKWLARLTVFTTDHWMHDQVFKTIYHHAGEQ
jgi:hypothetical protein